MTKEEFNNMVERYLAGEATPSEKRLIDNFFHAKQKKHALNDGIGNEMWKFIESHVQPALPVRATRKVKLLHVLMTLSVLAVLCSGFFYYQYTVINEASEWITKEAPYGQKSIVTLTDGSKVFLNSGSSISFPREFSQEIREITLSGEAFFEVVKNPAQPFIVRSANVTTKVLGTSFNIQAFVGNEIRVTVETGKVQVDATIQDEESGTRMRQVFLNPSEQAVLKGQEWSTSRVDLNNSLAWRNNTIRFDEATMAEVANELERWYNVRMSFENEGIRNCLINGQFKDQSLENVLKSIQYMYNVDFKYTNQNQIILYGNGCTK